MSRPYLNPSDYAARGRRITREAQQRDQAADKRLADLGRRIDAAKAKCRRPLAAEVQAAFRNWRP
jgi:hypothetical protein